MAIEGLLTIKYFIEGLVKRTHQRSGVLQPQNSFLNYRTTSPTTNADNIIYKAWNRYLLARAV
jgi:hypothetical protein